MVEDEPVGATHASGRSFPACHLPFSAQVRRIHRGIFDAGVSPFDSALVFDFLRHRGIWLVFIANQRPGANAAAISAPITSIGNGAPLN